MSGSYVLTFSCVDAVGIVAAQGLARAVRWIAERRVLIDGRKTVVFR